MDCRENLLTDPSNQDREISVTTKNISVDVWSSVLTIRALPINNWISVGCTVVSSNPHSYEHKYIDSQRNSMYWLSFHVTSCITGILPVVKLQSLLSWSSPTETVIITNK